MEVKHCPLHALSGKHMPGFSAPSDCPKGERQFNKRKFRCHQDGGNGYQATETWHYPRSLYVKQEEHDQLPLIREKKSFWAKKKTKPWNLGSINNTMKGQKESYRIGVFVFNFSIYHIPRAGFIIIGRECFRGHPGSGKCGHLHFETQNCVFLQLLSHQLSGDHRLSSSWPRDSRAEWFSLVTEITAFIAQDSWPEADGGTARRPLSSEIRDVSKRLGRRGSLWWWTRRFTSLQTEKCLLPFLAFQSKMMAKLLSNFQVEQLVASEQWVELTPRIVSLDP